MLVREAEVCGVEQKKKELGLLRSTSVYLFPTFRHFLLMFLQSLNEILQILTRFKRGEVSKEISAI